jgi:hypothetical protein
MELNSETTTFTDSIVFDVIKDIAHRAEVGLKKYNTTMDREDLIASDWVQHAYEEALDMAIYLKRLKKDMLAMEEELRAFKTQKTKSLFQTTDTVNFTHFPPLSGTAIAYTTITPKPNETYTDLERKPRAWHH